MQLQQGGRKGCVSWARILPPHLKLDHLNSTGKYQPCSLPFHLSQPKRISPSCQMDFSKLPNVFLQINKCISPKFLQNFSKLPNVFVQITKCVSPNCQMYLSKLPNVFLQIENVFVQIVMAGSTT